MSDVFQIFQEHMSVEQEIRDDIRTAVREIEQTSREILTVLQDIHQEHGVQSIPKLCEQSKILFGKVKDQYVVLKEKVPENQYYRFHDHWRFTTQRLVFLVALSIYLETESLATREQVCSLLGVEMKRENGFHLDLEDYLNGLLLLASELSRFAVNSVTAGDYNRPEKLLKFLKELNSGFRLLNLKNDQLRKRYDALKYDLKKVEEVVYDLSVRGLKSERAVAPIEK